MDEKKIRQDLLNSIDTNKIDNISSAILQKYQLQHLQYNTKTMI